MWHFTNALLVGAILSLTAVAASAADGNAEANIRARFEKIMPEYRIDSIDETPIPGLYEVVMGADVVYVSGDGSYLLQGRLMDLAKRVDLTEPRRAMARKQAVDRVGDDRMVIFAPENFAHTMTVFTDIDCGYCRKLHREIDDYEAEGIRVRYMFFPRAGVGSDSYKKSVAVWCADDRQEALTDAKAGKDLDLATCDNPIDEHMRLGEQLGVNGTPAILLESGELIPGYVPAKRLAGLLGVKAEDR